MTVVYQKSEGKSGSARPVAREIAIGDAAGDSTGWLPLGKDPVTVEVRSVTISGTRTERDTSRPGTPDREVVNYLKDQFGTAWASVAVVETKQEYEDDAQAGVIETITGGDFVQNMEASETADLVRVRLVTPAAGESIYMAVAKRSTDA